MSEENFQEAWVFVVDDDRACLAALERLLSLHGYRVAAFTSPARFLDQHDPNLHGCVLLDLQMSELSGLEVQTRLLAQGESHPVVFLTGTDRAEVAVQAMKAGAHNYLIKPIDADSLLDTVQGALEADKDRLRERMELSELESRWRLVSNREREVFWHVVNGRLNKQIAHEMQITEKTVKVHRAKMMDKLNARSLAGLVQMAARVQPLCQ
jgi:FixJ family two-component response regulator